MDSRNDAACTRLAKYFKLNDNLIEAKNMYSRALEINPNNRGAINNLIEIENFQHDTEFLGNLTTSRDAYDAARSLATKGKYGLSIACFLKAYSIEPLLKYAFALAKVYKKTDKFDEVKKMYNQLLNSNPTQNNLDAINAEFVVLMQR